MNTRNLFSITLFSAALAGYSAYGIAADAPVKVSGDILIGSNDMTLYTFDRDTPNSNKSACNDACAKNWPPLTANAGEAPQGDYGIVTRDDGSKQWAYKGRPLYYWAKDAKPGDKTGDGVNNVWRVAKP